MPAGFGNFAIEDCFPQIQEYCAGRVFPQQNMINWVYRAVLELSKDYWFQGLQATGPLVNFVPAQNLYDPSFFSQPADSQLDLTKIVSFFMYYPPALSPASLSVTGTNPGITLKYREVASAENTLNISSFPSYWSRWAGQILVSPNPIQNFMVYMRYQKQHPWTIVSGKPAPAATDTIYLDDDWQDIVEYAAAMRAANSVRLLDISADIHQILYGSPDFQKSGGTKGYPGLIFARISQYQRDSVTATRSVQLRSM